MFRFPASTLRLFPLSPQLTTEISIHLDIKPANILVFRDKAPSGARSHNCRFKLADFGSSPARALLAGQDLKAEDTGGTPMYSKCCSIKKLSFIQDLAA